MFNADDPVGAEWARTIPGKSLTFSAEGKGSDLRALDPRFSLEGLEAEIRSGNESIHLKSPMLGKHNLANALGAIAVARALGLDLRAAAEAIGSVRSVAGRLERVENNRGIHVFVDYAHTADALENVLDTLKPYAKRRIVAVFGCGGDRDRSKRPLMAETVCARADVAVFTSDNPRTEDPRAILDEMLAGKPAGTPLVSAEGLSGETRGAASVMVDRKAAIRRALEIAVAGDVLLIAGKGHETYQEIHGVRHPFDDREIAREWCEENVQ